MCLTMLRWETLPVVEAVAVDDYSMAIIVRVARLEIVLVELGHTASLVRPQPLDEVNGYAFLVL